VIGELDRYHGFGLAEIAPAPVSPGAGGAPGRRPRQLAEPAAQDAQLSLGGRAADAGAEIFRPATR
jgi:hypothetical protein